MQGFAPQGPWQNAVQLVFEVSMGHYPGLGLTNVVQDGLRHIQENIFWPY